MIIGLQCMLKVTYQWAEPEPKHDVYECLVTFENSSVYYGRHAQQTRTLYFCPVVWFLLSSLFSSPNLSRCRLDVYHTFSHGLALVRIQGANLKCTARGSLKMQDAKNRQKFAICFQQSYYTGVVLYEIEICISEKFIRIKHWCSTNRAVHPYFVSSRDQGRGGVASAGCCCSHHQQGHPLTQYTTYACLRRS